MPVLWQPHPSATLRDAMPRPSTALPPPPLRPALPIDRSRPAAGQVYETLRHAIVTLDYAPGVPLSETAFAARTAVSRTPVREAFKRLAAEGLIEIFPNLGTFVSRIDLREVEEALVIRTLLEGEAAARAAAGADAAFLAARLEALTAEQEAAVAAGDTDAAYACDERFHAALFAAIGFARAWESVRLARGTLERLHHLMVTERRTLSDAVGQHRTVIAAIAAGEAEAARGAMAAHIAANGRFLEQIGAARHPWLKDTA
jgi:DNA-binding GntR family transcriptional regulator